MPSKVEIKGFRDGLLATLGQGEWPELTQALISQVEAKGDFFRGARLAIDVGNHALHAAELSSLSDTLSRHDLNLWAVISNSPLTEQNALALGLTTQLVKPRPEPENYLPETTYHDGEQAIVVQRTLRSGFKLEFPGHIIVIGDVNPGAEIVAVGSVIVWGRLRGVVHAGAEGNESAVISALDLSPTQLRIAGQVAITPKRRGKPQPETARLQDGQVIAETWTPKK